MSTILDALRKAQEETGGRREAPVGELPAGNDAPPPRRRRSVGWPVIVVGILAVAFVGGLALGDRIGALFGTSEEPAPEPVAAAPEAVAANAGAPQAGVPPAAAPDDARAVRGEPAAAPAPPPAAVGERATASDGQKGTAARANGGARSAAAVAKAEPEAPDAGPTPYGQLHVFGAGERPGPGKPSSEDRLARLQQLRDKMLKARQDAAARGGEQKEPPKQIFVPPPRPVAQDAAGQAKGPAPAEHAAPGSAQPGVDEGAGTAGVAPGEPPAPPAEPVEVAQAAVAAQQGEVAPAANGAEAMPADAAAAVGVSITNAHGEAADAEVRDPDIPPVPEDEPAPAAVDAPTTVAAEPAPTAEPPTTVASLPPQPAAPAAAAPPPPAASMPVLRRSPGGAPQVAINILQWSAEPGRRFAFVSVDGGGMTQVREGDRIGGLTVKHIHQQMIEFGFNDSSFLLRAN